MDTSGSTKPAVGRFIAPAPDLFLNEARAAELLSVNARTLQQWRLRGAGPRFVRISARCVRYRYTDLMKWTEDLLRSSASDRLL